MIGSKRASRAYSRRSLYGQVAHELGSSIIAGELQSGTVLPNEAALGNQLDVSRTALREAVKMLAAKGLVESRPKVGTTVRPRSAWNMLDPDVLAWHMAVRPDEPFFDSLFEVRLIIEPASAAMAAERATESQLQELRTAYDAMAAALNDLDASVSADLRFHQAVLTATGNAFLESLGSLIETALAVSFRLSDSSHPKAYEAALPEHRAVLESIEAGKPDAARAAMLELLLDAQADVRRTLRRRARSESLSV